MPPPYFCWKLLRRLAGDCDPEVSGAEGGGDEGEATFCGFQPCAGGLGRLRVPMDRGDGGGVSVSGRDQAEEDGGDGRELGADLEVV